jgi:hypothetical protein
MENISLTEAKWDGIQLSNAMHMHLEDKLDQAKTELGQLPH